MAFVHLHVHNEYSVLDGVGTSKEYARAANELGHTHLALTNHGNIDGAISHQKDCLDAGIIPIIGCEMYMVPDLSIKEKGERRSHLTLLVENDTGWRNILKLLTIANIDGFYRRPRIDFNLLKDHLDGLVVLTACAGTFLLMKNGVEILKSIRELVGPDRVFLEIMPHDLDIQRKVNRLCLDLSDELDIPLVATNDCHYVTKEASKHQEVLLAIQSKKKWQDPTRWKFSTDGFYMKSEEEMIKTFRRHHRYIDKKIVRRACRQSLMIAKICENFRIHEQKVFLPSIKTFANDNHELTFLENLIHKGFRKRLKGKGYSETKAYEERIKMEMELIISKGFVRYFLIVWDLITWCGNNDIMTGPGRGSVGGSLVAYLLFITDADPLKYGLEFFRFVSADRNDLPDIDMDFEDIRRPEVRKYLSEKYGEFNVVGLSNFLTMKGKGVLRDVSRVFDIDLDEVDVAAKSIIEGGDNEIENSLKESPELKRFNKNHGEIVEIAMSIEGQIRGHGQHAAGVCISEKDLREGWNCNIVKRDGVLVANWDMRNAEFNGLMKLDILGLSALTVLNETRKMIKINHDVDINFKDLPFDDPEVFKEISAGETVGAFQIGSSGLTKYCERLGVDNFEILACVTSLWRPGPMQSGMTEEFVEIKHGKHKIKKIHPIYDAITAETLGLIVYQEQVMKIVNQLAGIDMATCNKIRKIIGKSMGNAAFDQYRDQFINGCRLTSNMDPKKAGDIWDMMSKFGGYGFNKSHAVEYSMITYWDMWCKTYYPNEFLAACLTLGNKTKNVEYMREARRLGLKINLPKIGISDATRWLCDNKNNLYAPFISINGVGEPTARAIASAKVTEKKRAGFFSSEPAQKIKGVDRTVTSILMKIGAFDPNKTTTREDLQKCKQYFTF